MRFLIYALCEYMLTTGPSLEGECRGKLLFHPKAACGLRGGSGDSGDYRGAVAAGVKLSLSVMFRGLFFFCP